MDGCKEIITSLFKLNITEYYDKLTLVNIVYKSRKEQRKRTRAKWKKTTKQLEDNIIKDVRNIFRLKTKT